MASGAVLGDAGERPPEDLRAAGRDACGDQPACCNPAVGLGILDLTAAAEFAVQVAATVVTRFGARPV